MKLWKLILFIIVYTLGYFLVALNVVGMEGRGPTICFSPFSPFGLPWLLLIVAIYLLSHRSSSNIRLFFVSLMVGHYAITAANAIATTPFGNNETEALNRVMEMRPDSIYYALAWYVVGQVIIWLVFIKSWMRIQD